MVNEDDKWEWFDKEGDLKMDSEDKGLVAFAVIAISVFVILMLIFSLSTSNTVSVPSETYTFTPVQGPEPYYETFFYEANTSIAGTTFSHSFNLEDIALSGSNSRFIEFEVPLGGISINSTKYELSLAWVNLNVTVNGMEMYNHNVNVNKSAIYSSSTSKEAYVGFNFMVKNNSYGDTIFTLTEHFNYSSNGYIIDGLMGSITNCYSGVYFNEGVHWVCSINIGNVWYYNVEQASISHLLTSKIVKFSLVWNSTVPICLTYNGTTENGSSGVFSNIIPTLNSISITNIFSTTVMNIFPVSQFKAPDGYTVTFRLTDVKMHKQYTI